MTMESLNNRPRKILGYQTPNQVFFRSGVELHILTRGQMFTGDLNTAFSFAIFTHSP
jgi:hypothetical protein